MIENITENVIVGVIVGVIMGLLGTLISFLTKPLWKVVKKIFSSLRNMIINHKSWRLEQKAKMEEEAEYQKELSVEINAFIDDVKTVLPFDKKALPSSKKREKLLSDAVCFSFKIRELSDETIKHNFLSCLDKVNNAYSSLLNDMISSLTKREKKYYPSLLNELKNNIEKYKTFVSHPENQEKGREE